MKQETTVMVDRPDYKKIREEWDKDKEYSPPRLHKKQVLRFAELSLEEPEIVGLVKSLYDEQSPLEERERVQIEEALFEYAKSYVDGTPPGSYCLTMQSVNSEDSERSEWIVKIAKVLREGYPVMLSMLKDSKVRDYRNNDYAKRMLKDNHFVIYVPDTVTVEMAPRLSYEDVLDYLNALFNDPKICVALKSVYDETLDLTEEEREYFSYELKEFLYDYISKETALLEKQDRDQWPWYWKTAIKRVFETGTYVAYKVLTGEIRTLDRDEIYGFFNSKSVLSHINLI